MDERRSVGRTRILRNAEIVVDGRTVTKIQCTLQDVTNTGACLTLASTYRVPDTFELTFDQGRSRRPCRVKWRTGDRLGVSFEQHAENGAAAGVA
jgi:PilZ domain-containing protein